INLTKGAWKTAQTMLGKSYRDDEIGLNSYGPFDAFKNFNAFDVNFSIPLGDHLAKWGNKYAYYFDFQYDYINKINTEGLPLSFKDLNSDYVNSKDRVVAEYIDI